MSRVVIRLVSRVSARASPFDGQYLTRYDPTMQPDGAFVLETSPDKSKAKPFDTVAEAFAFYRQVCPNKRYDSPGHLNRPLTAFSIEFESA